MGADLIWPIKPENGGEMDALFWNRLLSAEDQEAIHREDYGAQPCRQISVWKKSAAATLDSIRAIMMIRAYRD